MTKKNFLLKMNLRLVPLNGTRKNEIINHYRTVIDQSMANGNTEESAVDSLGSVNTLCSLILKKEHKTRFVPTVMTVLNVLYVIIASLVLVGCIGLLLGATGVIGYIGYNFVNMAIKNLIPSALLLSTSIVAVAFKAGACLIVASILVVLLLIAKTFLKGAVKIFLFIIEKVKDSVYRAQSTKLMKGAFKNETID